jgi:hypothetical protein
MDCQLLAVSGTRRVGHGPAHGIVDIFVFRERHWTAAAGQTSTFTLELFGIPHISQGSCFISSLIIYIYSTIKYYYGRCIFLLLLSVAGSYFQISGAIFFEVFNTVQNFTDLWRESFRSGLAMSPRYSTPTYDQSRYWCENTSSTAFCVHETRASYTISYPDISPLVWSLIFKNCAEFRCGK